jgi:thioredoxin-like negative regulator of GroEL
MRRATELVELLGRLTEPADIVVVTAPGCPNCRQAVEAAETLAAVNLRLTVRVVDATEEPELAARWRVRSVPTTVVDDSLTIVGATSAEALARRLLELEGPDAERKVLGSLVAAGRFDAAAGRLADEAGRAAFAELWRGSAFEGHMGLMLTAEEAVAAAPDALDELVEHLLPVLAGAEPTLAGNTADLMGLIGSPVARPALEALAESTDPDIAEAATDALERLRDSG